MSDTSFLSPAALEALFAALEAKGYRVLAPVTRDARTELQEIHHPDAASRGHLQTVLSAKSVVFPRIEPLLTYALHKDDVQIQSATPKVRPTVLFGLRPCEARAFTALDAVFNWETRDAFFNARMAHTAVIALACTEADEACFCTSVGGGPEHRGGADLFLQETPGGYLVDVCSPKGAALQALAPHAFQPSGSRTPVPAATLAQAFDGARLPERIAAHFDDECWRTQSLGCIGCGACAYVCPTCLCFDIQEASEGTRGSRVRCWDSCGLAHFTLHASGHNPRPHQSQRWRQRVHHKFRTYPERHGMPGCVGCGKCTRACPVDMNLGEHLRELAER